MNVKVAETAGFCFGVQRAVDRVYELIGSDAAPIYTLGPIIHNEEVVSDLEKKGVAVICEKDLGSLKGGTVVIRSHGAVSYTHLDVYKRQELYTGTEHGEGSDEYSDGSRNSICDPGIPDLRDLSFQIYSRTCGRKEKREQTGSGSRSTGSGCSTSC